MDMYIRQKVFSIGDRYNVFDINQNLLYRVEGEILTFGAKRTCATRAAANCCTSSRNSFT